MHFYLIKHVHNMIPFNSYLYSALTSLILLVNPMTAKPSQHTCDGTHAYPCIVEDTETGVNGLKRFRTAKMILETYKGNISGLEDLYASGSGAMKEDDYSIIKNIAGSIAGSAMPIIDLDLREESHGYINGIPITLMIENDWINLGKSHDESILAESEWVHELSQHENTAWILTNKQYKEKNYELNNPTNIHSHHTEEAVAKASDFHYIRFTVTDHMAPRDEEVDRFISLIDDLKSNAWIHIHCRGGEGRTTTFFAMYDMLLNADKVSFDDIIKRQASVAPFYDLSVIKRSNPDLTVYYEKRYEFIKQFYLYALARKLGFNGTWSEWKNQ